MDLATIQIKVDTRDVKSAEKDLDHLGKTGSDVGKKVNKSNDEMASSAGKASSAFRLMGAALAAVGAGQVLSKIVTDTNHFNKAISELGAITGATGEDLQFYREQAALIGQTTTLSASQAATAFQLIASAKPDLLASRDALAAVTQEAVLLAEAASIDLTEAAQTVGVSLNQFGAGAEEASRFVNVLAAGSKFGSSLINQTSEALKNAGTAASLAGLSFEEANVGVQLLAKGGLFAAEAGTGFRQVLMKLESEAEDKFKPSVVGLTVALENLAAENMSLTDIMDMFGAEAAKSAATMINSADSARILEQQLTGTDTAAEQAAVNFDNLTGDLLSLESANESLAIAIGQKLDPKLRSVTQTLTAFSVAAAGVITSGEIGEYFSSLSNGVEAFGIAAAAYFAPAVIGGIVTAVGAIRTAVIAMNAAMLNNPMGLVLAAVGAASYLLITNIDTVKLAAQKSAVAIEIAWNKLKLWFMKSFASAINSVADGFTKMKNDAIAGFRALTAAVKDPLNAIETYNSTFEQTLKDLDSGKSKTDVFAGAIADTETNISNLEREMEALNTTVIKSDTEIGNTTSEIEALGKELEDTTNPAITDMGSELEDNTTPAIVDLAAESSKAVQPIEDMTEATKEGTVAFELQKNMLRNLQEDFGDMIYKTLTDGKLNFKDFFGSVVDGFKRMVSELAAQKIMDAIFGGGGLNGFLSKLSGGFGSVISSIASGIGGMVSSAAAGIAGLVSGGGGAAAAQSAIAAGTSTMASSAAAAAGGTAAGGAAAGGGIGAGISAGLAKAGSAISAAGAKALAIATNPITLTVAAAALAAKALDSGGTPTSSAGITMAKTAGMSDANVFSVPEFESGFAPLGFKQNATNDQAAAAVAPLRELDATLTALAKNSGYNVNLSGHTFSGLGVEGEGPGTFLGVSIEEGKIKGTPIEEQMDMYAKEWIYAVGARNGVPQSALDDIVGGGDAAGILSRSGDVLKGAIDGSHRDGLDMVPHDGYVAELHAGERVQTASQARAADSMAAEMSGLRGSMEEIMIAVARNTAKLYRLNDRWDKNGLPPVRA
jgi:TP901 family phage tail tape measure protein